MKLLKFIKIERFPLDRSRWHASYTSSNGHCFSLSEYSTKAKTIRMAPKRFASHIRSTNTDYYYKSIQLEFMKDFNKFADTVYTRYINGNHKYWGSCIIKPFDRKLVLNLLLDGKDIVVGYTPSDVRDCRDYYVFIKEGQ